MSLSTCPFDPENDLRPDDRRLVEALESCSLDAGSFGHEEHVRSTWVYLRLHGLSEGSRRFIEALRRFAAFHGAPGKYHETITWLYLTAINERIGAMPPSHGWEEFAARYPELLGNHREFLARYYRPETLEGDIARRSFVLPDRGLVGSSGEATGVRT